MHVLTGLHAADARQPNIVLIAADDRGYEWLGANGSTFYKTPNLDRLAARGARFERAYSQPICTPSRVQIMTRRYNLRNYVRFGFLGPEQFDATGQAVQAKLKSVIDEIYADEKDFPYARSNADSKAATNGR